MTGFWRCFSFFKMKVFWGVLGNVKLISCLVLHGKKFNAQSTKIIFVKKSQCTKRNFYFILSNCHGNAFLWKNLSGRSLWIVISLIKRWRHSVFSVKICIDKKKNKQITSLVDNFSQCIITPLSFLLFTFLD